MHEGETLKAYSDRYWEMYNELDENHDDVAISTFKSGLPTEHGLRKSLTGKPVSNVHQLMDRIDKYKRVEEDQLQGKGKEKISCKERERRRSSPPKQTILGPKDIAITSRGEISQDRLGKATCKWLVPCSKCQYKKFWRK